LHPSEARTITRPRTGEMTDSPVDNSAPWRAVIEFVMQVTRLNQNDYRSQWCDLSISSSWTGIDSAPGAEAHSDAPLERDRGAQG